MIFDFSDASMKDLSPIFTISRARNLLAHKQFLDPETPEKLPFLDPEIIEIVQNISASINCQNGEISGSRNGRNGRQILYAACTYYVISFCQILDPPSNQDKHCH